MKRFIENLNSYSHKHSVVYLLIVCGFLFVLCSSFVSCVPPGVGLDSTRNGAVVPDEDDSEEGCKEHSICKELCERIYNTSWRLVVRKVQRRSAVFRKFIIV